MFIYIYIDYEDFSKKSIDQGEKGGEYHFCVQTGKLDAVNDDGRTLSLGAPTPRSRRRCQRFQRLPKMLRMSKPNIMIYTMSIIDQRMLNGIQYII